MHNCQALAIYCIDFRFRDAIRKYLEKELGLHSHDTLTIPGAAKHLTERGSDERKSGLLEDIGVSVRLHQPQQIVLINHGDCGAYGGRVAFPDAEAEKREHIEALKQAKQVLAGRYPEIAVTTHYADIREDNIFVIFID